VPTVYARALKRAAEIAGGREQLAVRLEWSQASLTYGSTARSRRRSRSFSRPWI
jgi:hypothetical protein